MNRDKPNKEQPNISKLIGSLGNWIISFIVFGTTVYGAVKLLRDDSSVAGIIFLSTGIAIIWLGSIYTYRKQIVVTQQSGKSHRKKPSKPNAKKQITQYAYARWKRLLALLIIVGVPIFLACVVGYQIHLRNLPPDKIIILVADFDGPEPKTYRVTEIILNQLKNATKEYPDIQVQPLGEAITEQQGSHIAHEKGANVKASIVLWGWYGKTGTEAYITTYFEILRGSPHLALYKDQEQLTVPVSDLDGFKVQKQLSSEIDYLILTTVGLARYEAQDYIGAINRFTAALDQPVIPSDILNPASLYFYRANARQFRGETDLAISDYTQAIERNDREPIFFNNRGCALNDKREFNDAIKDFDRSIELKPDNSEAYCNRGISFHNKGEFDLAIRDYNRALEINKENAPLFYNNIGLALQDKGDITQALSAFDKSISLKPDAPDAYYNRGGALVDKGEIDKGINDFNILLTINPTYAAGYNRRGIAYSKKGDFDNAFKDFAQAIKLEPSFADAFYNRGTSYLSKGDFDAAIKNFQQAIELKPDDADYYFNCGAAYGKKEQIDLAIEYTNKGLQINPHNCRAYFNLGVIYAKSARFDLAYTYFQKAVEVDNDSEYSQKAQENFEEVKQIVENIKRYGFDITDFNAATSYPVGAKVLLKSDNGNIKIDGSREIEATGNALISVPTGTMAIVVESAEIQVLPPISMTRYRVSVTYNRKQYVGWVYPHDIVSKNK